MSQRLQPTRRAASALRNATPATPQPAPYVLRRSAISPQVLLGLTIGAMLVAAPLANAQTRSAAEPAPDEAKLTLPGLALA